MKLQRLRRLGSACFMEKVKSLNPWKVFGEPLQSKQVYPLLENSQNFHNQEYSGLGISFLS
jgi:hypothetical protein